MKKVFPTSFLFVVMIAVALAAVALADTLPRPVATTFVPKIANATCTTIGPGKTSSATINLNGSRQVTWQAFDSAGTDVIVKRFLDSNNTAYMKSAGKAETVDLKASAFVFKRFSSADNQITTNICSDLD